MIRSRSRVLAGAALLLMGSGMLVSCDGQVAPRDNRQEQSAAARDAANSLVFTGNAEVDNIRRRLELTSDPGLLGYIVLLNEMGQPILYEGVRGKITSGSKRLREPDRMYTAGNGSGGTNLSVRAAASDEGTWGTSNPYIFYFNTDGVYRQWVGPYLYSTQPIRLRQEPLVISHSEPPAPTGPVDVSPRRSPPR